MQDNIKNLFKNRVFFLLFLTSQISHSQFSQFYHGLELGVNMNNADFMINESAEPSSSFGFFIGYLAERDLSDNLYVRLGINFSRKEFKAISRRGINTTEEKWGIDGIEIPLNLGYYVNWNNKNLQFFVDAGINFGYNSKAVIENNEETIRLDIGSDAVIKRIAIGANAGTGLLIKKRTKLRLNYYSSLSNIANTEGDIWKNKTFSFSLSYFLKEKKGY